MQYNKPHNLRSSTKCNLLSFSIYVHICTYDNKTASIGFIFVKWTIKLEIISIPTFIITYRNIGCSAYRRTQSRSCWRASGKNDICPQHWSAARWCLLWAGSILSNSYWLLLRAATKSRNIESWCYTSSANRENNVTIFRSLYLFSTNRQQFERAQQYRL